ncbi:hypothetical protein AVEN_166934-1, partial [Araneus ventricosus]
MTVNYIGPNLNKTSLSLRKFTCWMILDLEYLLERQLFHRCSVRWSLGLVMWKETVNGQLVAKREERKKPKNNEIEDCHTWHNAGWREKLKKQKNKEIADCQTWHNVARREEPKKSEEQRNSRL